MALEPRSPGRMWIALGLLVIFCGLAVKTIDPGKIRMLVFVLLGGFALRILLTAGRQYDEEENPQ